MNINISSLIISLSLLIINYSHIRALSLDRIVIIFINFIGYSLKIFNFHVNHQIHLLKQNQLMHP